MFTYPFCYVPSKEVREAAERFIRDVAPGIHGLAEGKMIGVLITDKGPFYSFSGTLGGRGTVNGFVPPIFDWTVPDGYFRRRESEISAMREGPEKSAASAALQGWLFGQYVVRNAHGEQRSIRDIFADRGLVPPAATGDCAAPKLLQYAYAQGLTPLSMGEFWYGAPPGGEVREQGRFYPACTGRCGPLLSFMMQGLEVEPNPLDAGFPVDGEPDIVYEDEYLTVVDKPSGMLSVPGRGKRESLLEWLRERYGEMHSCHRLDMDTSGLIVYARSLEVKSAMEAMFASRLVQKTYRARLCSARPEQSVSGLCGSELAPMIPSAAALHGVWRHSPRGTIALPLSLDYYDRPRQMVDFEHGKMAVTKYEVLQMLPDGEIEIRFTPLTGRTHQLRVHAAHSLGLERPIKGDRLYGSPSADRLYLRAESLKFTHPVTGCELDLHVREPGVFVQ